MVPAAATIPILTFVVSHLPWTTSSRSSHEVLNDSKDITLSIDAFQRATASHPSGIPGRTVWDLLLNKLWKIDSLDALHLHFDLLPLLLQKSKTDGHDESANEDLAINRISLSRASPLGVFVRRAQLEFSRLQFHDGVVLWRSFMVYRYPTLGQWKKRNPRVSVVNIALDSGISGAASSAHLGRLKDDDRVQEGASISADDVDRILEDQVERMQSIIYHTCPCSCVADIFKDWEADCRSRWSYSFVG